MSKSSSSSDDNNRDDDNHEQVEHGVCPILLTYRTIISLFDVE